MSQNAQHTFNVKAGNILQNAFGFLIKILNYVIMEVLVAS